MFDGILDGTIDEDGTSLRTLVGLELGIDKGLLVGPFDGRRDGVVVGGDEGASDGAILTLG
eukprot:scaffold46853_cov49-Attheya_sp.AAC.2